MRNHMNAHRNTKNTERANRRKSTRARARDRVISRRDRAIGGTKGRTRSERNTPMHDHVRTRARQHAASESTQRPGRNIRSNAGRNTQNARATSRQTAETAREKMGDGVASRTRRARAKKYTQGDHNASPPPRKRGRSLPARGVGRDKI